MMRKPGPEESLLGELAASLIVSTIMLPLAVVGLVFVLLSNPKEYFLSLRKHLHYSLTTRLKLASPIWAQVLHISEGPWICLAFTMDGITQALAVSTQNAVPDGFAHPTDAGIVLNHLPLKRPERRRKASIDRVEEFRRRQRAKGNDLTTRLIWGTAAEHRSITQGHCFCPVCTQGTEEKPLTFSIEPSFGKAGTSTNSRRPLFRG